MRYMELRPCSHYISMSSISASRFSYQKLVRSQTQDEDYDLDGVVAAGGKSSISRKYWRLKRSRFTRVKVPSLKRFLRRKLMKSIPGLRGPVAKVLRRFKEGQAHLGDLFAGNYLFMQISPSSLNYKLHKSYAPPLDFSKHHQHVAAGW